ncbi:MAG: ErfK/YbiS/YcfS/YnhG [Candidatus Angelobacter sp.]|nr:ErfK/YbiS/YcfS/YnhG [Candidatus Angelobacter sp.]
MRRLDENQKAKTLRTSALLLVVSLLSFTPAFAQSAREVDVKTAKMVQRQIIVSIPDRQLALLEGGRVLKIYSVAVGAGESPSPEGEFTVMSRLENPGYYKPGTVIAPGKSNPLGTRWMGSTKRAMAYTGRISPTPSARPLPTVAFGCGNTISKSCSRWSASATRSNCVDSAMARSHRSLLHHPESDPLPAAMQWRWSMPLR